MRQNGGFDRTAPSEFTAPLPDAGNTAAQALAAKFGFVPRGGLLVRRRVPDLTAVELTHRFLRSTLAPGGLYLDATCGNGGDTAFLCRLVGEEGRVVATVHEAQHRVRPTLQGNVEMGHKGTAVGAVVYQFVAAEVGL